MSNWKDNIHFVLVGPREPGNIGASARAIKNMGFKKFSLVNPPAITDEARWLACNAIDVLESAKTYNNLQEAVKNKSIMVGTTRRKGRKRGLILTVEDGIKRLYDLAQNNEIAILFGREDRGLFNEEIQECGFLITIPTSKEQPSLNLAHAVLIVAYELSKAEYKSPEFAGGKLIRQEELMTLYSRVSDILKLLEYIPNGDRDIEKKIMQNLKHFIGRAGLTDWELKMLHGICSQIEKKFMLPF
ncbi:MAG: RNA methyltransferase [Thermodesulfovibrionales bacterium]|nr:RNA methyltransferase [Thermodesulfovibrionales bacterium]